MKTYKGLIEELGDNQIFVFGSNPEGRHGAGTAKIALDNYGAVWGKGRGLQGKSYGLVTTNLTEDYYEPETHIFYQNVKGRSVKAEYIKENIIALYTFASQNPNLEFLVAYTPYGRLLCGYTIEEMAEMFSVTTPPTNVVFNEDFAKLLEV